MEGFDYDQYWYDLGFKAHNRGESDRSGPTDDSPAAWEWHRGWLDAAYYDEKYRYDYEP